MKGTETQPIHFEPVHPGDRWGVVAIQGAKAAGSALRHVRMRGGTGARAGLTRFIAMLSIHDTSDILLEHLDLGDNAVEDDLVHIIYTENMTVRDVTIAGAMADAIDVDISSVTFEGGSIIGSGNDAIDLMSSNASIRGIYLGSNGDKGISVGEASTVSVRDVQFRSNVIAIQSKDGSNAEIRNSQFIGNRTQLSAYQKNWRYRGGGRITVRESKFEAYARDNEFSADPVSEIRIFDSTIHGEATVEGRILKDGQLLPVSRK